MNIGLFKLTDLLSFIVSVAGDFIYENDKVAPVTLGKPIEIPCPKHEPSFGVTYRWGGYSSVGDPSTFLPLLENERIAVTLDGTLVVMFVTMQDVFKVNNMGGILCEMALGSEKKRSHKVSFKLQGNGKSLLLKGAIIWELTELVTSSFVSFPRTPTFLPHFDLLFPV